MSKLLVLIGLFCFACNGETDDPTQPDAPPPDATAIVDGDFSCASTPWPTTAPDPLAIEGFVGAAGGIGDVAVEIRDGVDDRLLGQATTSIPGPTSQGGRYSIDVATGGMARRVYRKLVKAGFVDWYEHDAFAVFANVPIDSPLQTEIETDSYYETSGVVRDPAKGTLYVRFFDCKLPPMAMLVQGITADAPAGSRVVYVDAVTQNPDPNLTATSSAGQLLVLNAPIGDLDLVIHAGAVTYRSWPVHVRPNVWTASIRYP